MRKALEESLLDCPHVNEFAMICFAPTNDSIKRKIKETCLRWKCMLLKTETIRQLVNKDIMALINSQQHE